MIEKFKLATLSSLDGGRVREAFEQALRRCEADCKDRPGMEEARTVTLKVSLVPCQDDKGDMESCDVRFQVVDSIPARKSRVYNMKSNEKGLFFNELSPDDVRQRSIDEPTPKPKKVGGA